jgi:hypothetical protein
MLTSCQINLLAVIWECPLQVSLENCPFTALRKKSLTEQVEEVLILTEKEAEVLFNSHYTCLHYPKLGDLDAISEP